MNVEQIVELIQAVSASSVGELNYEEGGVKLSLKKEKNKIKTETETVPSVAVQQEPEGKKPTTESEKKRKLYYLSAGRYVLCGPFGKRGAFCTGGRPGAGGYGTWNCGSYEAYE